MSGWLSITPPGNSPGKRACAQRITCTAGLLTSTFAAGVVRTVLLAPRQHADAPIRLVNVQNYPASVCRPTPVDGLRVYVPGSRLAKFIPFRTTGCRSTNVTTIDVMPLAR